MEQLGIHAQAIDEADVAAKWIEKFYRWEHAAGKQDNIAKVPRLSAHLLGCTHLIVWTHDLAKAQKLNAGGHGQLSILTFSEAIAAVRRKSACPRHHRIPSSIWQRMQNAGPRPLKSAKVKLTKSAPKVPAQMQSPA